MRSTSPRRGWRASAASQAGYGWLTPALGVLVAVNGLGHLAGSLVTRSYSPGLVSGLLLWLPLGVFAIAVGYRTLPSSAFLAGLGAGVLAQAVVAAIALTVSLFKRRPSGR